MFSILTYYHIQKTILYNNIKLKIETLIPKYKQIVLTVKLDFLYSDYSVKKKLLSGSYRT